MTRAEAEKKMMDLMLQMVQTYRDYNPNGGKLYTYYLGNMVIVTDDQNSIDTVVFEDGTTLVDGIYTTKDGYTFRSQAS